MTTTPTTPPAAPTSPAEPKANPYPHDAACMGLTYLTKGLGMKFRVLEGPGEIGREFVLSLDPVIRRFQVGGVYGVRLTEDNKISYPKQPISTYRRQYGTKPGESESDLVEWQVNTRAIRVEAEMEAAAKKNLGVDHLAKLLEPVRKVYRTAMPNKRRALEALVLQALRAGVSFD